MEKYLKYWKEDIGFNSNLIENQELTKEQYISYFYQKQETQEYYSVSNKNLNDRFLETLNLARIKEIFIELEIYNFKNAIEFVEKIGFHQKKEINNEYIKQISKILLENFNISILSRLFVNGLIPTWDKKTQKQVYPNIIGEYRTTGLEKNKSDGSKMVFMNPFYIESNMIKNLEKYNSIVNDPMSTEIEKANAALLFHINFEFIHPFAEGNGRTGRLILDWMFFRQNLFPINIKNKKNHEEYLKLLNKTLSFKEKNREWTLIEEIPSDFKDFFYKLILNESKTIRSNELISDEVKKNFNSTNKLLEQIKNYINEKK
ncbi:hypothetical protein CG001_02350 [Mesoplasma coleopterae]|uniref:Fic family protein n=1 Tax=Mesoplasma coleopterae TaxID=324078 RepID=UPI000D0236FC|nr:Fic family protein [Mesoplasma coleopterae]AVN62469.1 hypothetical protein CG001_02350 [Mesoplasma coleopterae]